MFLNEFSSKIINSKIQKIDTLQPNKSLHIVKSNLNRLHYVPSTPNISKVQMKSPIIIEDMIKKFETDNNWIFSEEDNTDCFKLLSQVNFYTFKYYAKKEACSCFKDAKNIYYFDRFLQNNIQKITLDIEVGIRTHIVDSLSLHYFNLNTEYTSVGSIQPAQFYLNDDLYFTETGKHKKSTQRQKDVLSILYVLQNTINKNKENSNVKKELTDYSAVSAWVLFDLLTLGELSFFFSKLTEAKKKIVTNKLNQTNILQDEFITAPMLASWLNSIRHIRNKAAHGAKIYGESLNILSVEHIADKTYLNTISEEHKNHLVNVLLACRRIICCLDNYTQQNWNLVLQGIDTEIRSRELNFDKLGLKDGWLNYFLIP